MAHFAELDENNTVLQVIVVHNNELLGAGGNRVAKLKEFRVLLYDFLWSYANWVQTSYNQ